MKYKQNRLRKVFSVIAALGMFASTSGMGLLMPQVAEATNDQEPDKEEIWVCKTLLDSEGNLIAGDDNSQKYTIDFADSPMNPTINFNGALSYNTSLFSDIDDIDGGDAECQKSQFNNAHEGDYYYSEESIHKNPELYKAPLYHDGYQGQATNTSQLGVFDENEDVRDGHIVLNEGDDVRVLVVLNQLKEVQSEVPDSANLYATKVVCEDEADLPNWGDGDHDDITADTAQKWVDDSDGKCSIEDWDFQWASSDTENPGDSFSEEGTWTTFGSSTTVPETSFGDDEFVWVREVFDDDYVPFTGVNTDENISAEVYCSTDGLHYDNYDRVDDLEVGNDYYCVGFNALKDKPTEPGIGRCEIDDVDRWADSVESFDQGDRKDEGDVSDDRSDENEALGEEDDADTDIDYVSLGFGGEIVLEFNQPFVDAPGDDIKVYETSYGNPSFAMYPEQAEVSVSPDGVNFTLLGTAQLDTTFDLADSSYTDPVRFIKLVDISDKDLFSDDTDGFDLAGIEVLACDTDEEPILCIAGDNLLENPGFENPVVGDNAGWDIFASGFSGLEWLVDWITPAGAPDDANAELHAGVNAWLASEGDQYIELDSDYDGPGEPLNGESASTKISQTVDTVDGETYTLSYDFSPRPGTATAENTLKVWIDGVEVKSHSADGTGNADTDWNTFSYSFEATGATTTIAFSDGGTSNSNGTFLDNTSFECVPNPVNPEEPTDDFSITGNKTEVVSSVESDGEGWTINLLDLEDEMETLSVDSESNTGTDSSELTDEEMYLVQVSDDYKFGNSNRRADAEYSSDLGDWTDYADTYVDKLDLWVDGAALDWGTYNTAHTYYTFIEGDGTSVNFTINDTPRTDNDGTLTVKIYELDGLMSEITDEGGNYSFDDLSEGNYFVFEESQGGWTQIGPDSRSTDHCEFTFEEGTGTQSEICDFVNEGEEEESGVDDGDDDEGESEEEGGEETAPVSSRTPGQFAGAKLTTFNNDTDDGDDDTEGEVRGASISYPGLPNAGVAPVAELVQRASTNMTGFSLYALTSRRKYTLRKKNR